MNSFNLHRISYTESLSWLAKWKYAMIKNIEFDNKAGIETLTRSTPTQAFDVLLFVRPTEMNINSAWNGS